jgi:hypothetical protein
MVQLASRVERRVGIDSMSAAQYVADESGDPGAARKHAGIV